MFSMFMMSAEEKRESAKEYVTIFGEELTLETIKSGNYGRSIDDSDIRSAMIVVSAAYDDIIIDEYDQNAIKRINMFKDVIVALACDQRGYHMPDIIKRAKCATENVYGSFK